MRNTLRLALSALIASLALGCLIPVPVGHHRDRGDDYRGDQDRHYDRDWDHGDRDWDRYGDRDRDGSPRDRDYDRRHR